ncbi:hypothetical protein YC2023_108199 [Brassica napus]
MDSHGRPQKTATDVLCVLADTHGHTWTHTDSHRCPVCAEGQPQTATDILCVLADTHERPVSTDVLVSTINDADQGSADVAFRTPLAPYEKSKFLGSGGSIVAWLKLKGIDVRAPPGVEPAA